MAAPDGLTLELGTRQLLCLDTPGHARHHLCVYDAQSQGIFTGDTFGLSYREFDTRRGPFILPTSTPVQFEPDAWHASLDRLLEFHPDCVYLTHFGRVDEPARLASQLHQGLDDFVAIARQAATDGRFQYIKAALRKWSLTRLSAHDCRLSTQQIDLLLEMDLELNAQGLEIWLERQVRNDNPEWIIPSIGLGAAHVPSEGAIQVAKYIHQTFLTLTNHQVQAVCASGTCCWPDATSVCPSTDWSDRWCAARHRS